MVMQSLRFYHYLLISLFYTSIAFAQQPNADTPTGIDNQIQKIDFRRGKNGEARLIVFLQHNQVITELKSSHNQLSIQFINTKLFSELNYILDLSQFGTLATRVEPITHNKHTELLINTNKAFDVDQQQLDNMLTFTLKPKTEIINPILTQTTKYTGKNITLNFQDIPIRKVLQIIADYNEFNLIVSDSVIGNITLRLAEVPWDQALDLILDIKDLGKELQDNILLIAPREELQVKQQEILRHLKEEESLEPLTSTFLQLNYAKAESIAAILQDETSSIISERGEVAFDPRTNTLLVKDTLRSIDNIKQALEILDIPVRQVLIESRIVSIIDEMDEEVGVRLGLSDQQGDDAISGSLDGANALSNGNIPSITDRLNVNLPIQNPAGSLAVHIARLGDGTLIDLELAAMEQENKAELISSPRIATADQKQARIEQGREIPYIQSSSSGATSVVFKKAVLSLEVTPHITPDHRIILDLTITQDTQGPDVTTPTGPAVSIDTQQIKTQVLVNNGETIVLGGIYQHNTTSTITKVPVLGDIPYLGRLFRSNSESNRKRELLIFVTPKIITEPYQ